MKTSRNTRLLILLLAILSPLTSVFAQKELSEKPKLVVGIVIDQMRWDYLTRYSDRYGEGGFKRLMSEGYNCNRLQINYIPAVTVVGHTCLYTGSVPAFTGIVSNSQKFDGKWDSPVRDNSCHAVGATCKNGNDCKKGKASPHRILVTTMTDELRLATNFRSKVISVAIKDRASIMPGGHAANAAYWLDDETQEFITSSFYTEEMPEWAKNFNKKGLGKKYLKLTTTDRKGKDGAWDLLYPEDTYVQSAGKNERYYSDLGNALIQSPYGNTYTTDMAIAALEGEQLGNNKDNVTDFLAISFSATDGIGHRVGPNAPWIEDTYLRLDKDIERLLNTLDQEVGKGEYVVWLSADHAASHSIEFRRDHNLPGAPWHYYRKTAELNKSLRNIMGIDADVIENLESNNVFFRNDVIKQICPSATTFKAYKKQIIDATIELLEAMPEVAYAFEFRNIPEFVPEPVRTMARNGYNPKLSGDIQIILEANVTEEYDDGYLKDFDGIAKGTQHSVWSPYDTHIPFIVMGKGIRHEWDNNAYTINDIAPTICSILNIQQPSGCIGKAINVKE